MLLTSLGAGALAGLASLPHCAGMCGPLAAAGCERGRSASATYHLARFTSYATLGAIAGVAGGSIGRLLPSRGATLTLGILMAAGLLLAAARVLGARPPRLVTLRIPSASRTRPAQSLLFPAFLGLGTGLLPCASLYGALLLAAAAGRAIDGAATLLAFAFVSAFGLASAQTLARWLETRGGIEGRRVVAFVLVVGAVLSVLRPVAEVATGGAACH